MRKPKRLRLREGDQQLAQHPAAANFAEPPAGAAPMDTPDDDSSKEMMLTNPVCPHCGQDSIRVFTCKLICDDCQHTEAVVHEPDEDERAFAARLGEMAARWHTTPKRMHAGKDYDPYDDPDWTA